VTVTIRLPFDIEADLVAQARAQGLEFDEPGDFNLAWTAPGGPEIDERLFAGLVFLSAAPHPVCAGSADTARKNA
jgi:hypothetical protein